MSKTITSPVKKWPGTVVLSDPLTFPQSFAFEDALDEAEKYRENKDWRHFNAALIPGILSCTEKWELKDFPTNPTLDNFPSTPWQSSDKLISWLANEIGALFQETEEIPNA